MSLLTNRTKRIEPPVKGSEERSKQASQADKSIRALEAKGYTVNRTDHSDGTVEWTWSKKQAAKPAEVKIESPAPKGRPDVAVMQADQKKSTGQKQVAKRVWDNEKKQWKMV